MIIECPGLIVKSEANARGNWRGGWARGKKQKERVMLEMYTAFFYKPVPSPPLAITLVRCFNGRGRVMDDDNFARACKAVRDGVAAFLKIDDGDDRLTFAYRQERGEPGIRIEITEAAK